MTTETNSKRRFTKTNLLGELYDRAEYLKRTHKFTRDTGWAQVAKSDKERNRAYGEWDILTNLIQWIDEGSFGTTGSTDQLIREHFKGR